MAARPRIRKRAHFPPNLHEPRPGYFTWRDPRDGKTHVIGRVTTAEAIHEALQANLVVERGAANRTLADRVSTGRDTVADLIAKMPTEGVKHATLVARSGFDRVIVKAIGHIECSALTTKDVSDMLEAIKDKGTLAYAKKIRTRISSICAKGITLGWMDRNPAAVTEKIKHKVKRRRLSLAEFNSILAKAPEVADWLPNAMLLALVSGQDRSTVARWERSFVKGNVAVVQRSKTSVRLAIPTALRMEAIGMSLADVIARCKSTGVVSKYLVHHTRSIGRTRRGDPVRLSTISTSFAEARERAGIHGDDAPTFHEIRSLCKRLYMEQGGIDTKALLGHMSDAIADLYANNRGLEPIKVSINAA
ncbi:phage integrase Arm DNA-binding domain-containing protein [Cupriavidus alkaliphilus]|uniref:phage integrase Arm DNA-binding domain-containing protein n=1 Tax=Cupriavidus alkaliphilus TaxID=942866 RepID=UPI00161F5B3E|nr:phage integrase Arm DNA-binding domain-containing protein [Cupriavidus alkaliphilus]MBB3011620.1 integrase [Cupriavidus alkaliphilus]